MGFPRETAEQALVQNGNDLTLAANWLIASKQQSTLRRISPNNRSSSNSSVSTFVKSEDVPVLVPTPAAAQQTPPLTNLENFSYVKQQQPQQQQPITKSNPIVAATAEQQHKTTRASRLMESRAKYSSLFGDRQS